MIGPCVDLSLFYQKYGREFIEGFKKSDTSFFVFKKNNQEICGHFLTYTDPLFPDKLFFGCFSLISEDFYPLDHFKEILLTTAKNLSKNQVIGPIDFSIWFGNRLKTNGFDHLYWWEPTGSAYLKMAFSKAHFNSDKKYLTHFFDDIGLLKKYFQPSYEKTLLDGYKILDFEAEFKKNPEAVLKRCYELNCETFKESHFYKDISLQEYNQYLFSKLSLLDNSLSSFIVTADNFIVGYAFCLIDKDLSGPLAVFKSILIHPDYQSSGLSSALVYEFLMKAEQKKIKRGAAALIREGAKSEYLFAKVAADLSLSHHYELYNLPVE
jgi:GNAT superfamily N-acetyltransferase